MNTYTLTPEERFDLILECRNSGLTDYQWCKQKGISTNTLYRWINKFRQNGYPNIPKAKGKSQIASTKQEVVKLDIVADIPCETSGYNFCENNGQEDGPDVFSGSVSPTMEIIKKETLIRVSNNVNPQLLDAVLSRLGGLL